MIGAATLVELPYRYDLTFHLNSDFLFEYWMSLEDETPINNASYRIDMEVRRAPGTPIIGSYTTVNGRITLGGSNGKITVSVPRADIVRDYAEGTYRYDLLQTDPSGFREPIFYGTITATAMITVGG